MRLCYFGTAVLGLLLVSMGGLAQKDDEAFYATGYDFYCSKNFVKAYAILFAYRDREPAKYLQCPVRQQSVDAVIGFCEYILSASLGGGPVGSGVSGVGGADPPTLMSPEPYFEVDLSSWPSYSSQQGSAFPSYDTYVMHSTGESWIGPGTLMPMTPIDERFVLEVVFDVLSNEDWTLQFVISEGVPGGIQYSFSLQSLYPESLEYSIHRETAGSGFEGTWIEAIAENTRVHLATSLQDWPVSHALTVERQDEDCLLYFNGQLLAEFRHPGFKAAKLGIAVSNDSMLAIETIQAYLIED